MSGILANAPVYYALVQVRFEPVASMSKYVAEIQDRLRKSGYPHYDVEQSQAMNFFAVQNGNPIEPPVGMPMPIANGSQMWYFSNSARNSGYILNNDFLTFQTTSYSGHESFFEDFLNGVDLVNEIVGLGNITRIGMRYLDAIIPDSEEKINDYLHPAVVGIEFGKSLLGGSWESAFNTDAGVLIAKVYRVSNQPVGTPIDLQIKSILMPEKFRSNHPIRHGVMDIDHFADTTTNAIRKQLLHRLSILHEGVSDCFKALTTEHAFKRWEK